MGPHNIGLKLQGKPFGHFDGSSRDAVLMLRGQAGKQMCHRQRVIKVSERIHKRWIPAIVMMLGASQQACAPSLLKISEKL